MCRPDPDSPCDLLRQYADVGLAGASKDEWGFMTHNEATGRMERHQEFFFSRFYARAYAETTGGRDLVADALLMSIPHRGQERERQRAINHYLWLTFHRNAEIEADFYQACKEILSPSAYVNTHPTWNPYPVAGEFTHNGLDWWAVRRDLAQTDEICPLSICTALAKKCNCPVWYNMFYGESVDRYVRNVWRYALAGGRQNIHPLYLPGQGGKNNTREDLRRQIFAVLREDLVRAECRVRLLNFIQHVPLDCRAAVVFGHTAAMNWAGPHFGDVGEAFALGLWQAGYPADLIPTSEIYDGSLQVDADGCVRYGPQRYDVVVLYHPEFERIATTEFFQAAVKGGRTALYRFGGWTRDFEAHPVNERLTLPAAMIAVSDITTGIAKVVAHLRRLGVPQHTPVSEPMEWFNDWDVARGKRMPPSTGVCHLIDGTWIHIAATTNPTGDPIRGEFAARGQTIRAEAVGLLAVRFAADGTLTAMAAGGVRQFDAGGLRIRLEQAADLALWREADGWHGVVQELDGPLPEALRTLTGDWLRLSVPTPFSR